VSHATATSHPQWNGSPVRGDLLVKPRQKGFSSSVRSGISLAWPTPTAKNLQNGSAGMFVEDAAPYGAFELFLVLVATKIALLTELVEGKAMDR